MGKYLQVMKISWQNTLIYKANFVMVSLMNILRVLAEIAFWRIFFNTTKDTPIGGYSFKIMVTYYFLMFFINIVANAGYVGERIASDLKEGRLNQFIIKPINYLVFYYYDIISRKIVESGFTLLVFSPVFILGFPQLALHVQPAQLLLLPIIILFSLTLSFLVNVIISLLTFWIIEVGSFFFLKDVTLDFLSGAIFPVDILPQYLFGALSFLPFMYIVYFPIRILNKGLSNPELFIGMAMQAAWILFLYFLIRYLWKRGLKHYTGTGM